MGLEPHFSFSFFSDVVECAHYCKLSTDLPAPCTAFYYLDDGSCQLADASQILASSSPTGYRVHFEAGIDSGKLKKKNRTSI